MQFIDKRSKLIGTIGPSSEKYEVLKELVLSGLTCVRDNHMEHMKNKKQNLKMLKKFKKN